MLNLNALRREYRQRSLEFKDLDPDPFKQFKRWFLEVQQAQIPEPNAMTLATANSQGHPSCRTVLLKEVDDRGFIFFTNKNSRKGSELAINPIACVTFYWHALERQVIIDGKIELLPVIESEAYFASRPRGSQLGAWASQQDQVISSRKVLEEARKHYDEKFAGCPIPMPPYWGGYRLLPERFEFWQGRPNRLHDRFRYLIENHAWQIDRLSP